MKQLAVTILVLPDGKFVFQRRGSKAPVAPNELGLFGGNLENGETPIEAVRRELGEETSLPVEKLAFTQLANFEIQDGSAETRRFYVFRTPIDTSDFDVFEGERAEIYSRSEALARSDLTVTTRKVIKELIEE
jgi:8-oxo-dGTP pyrophosphatase MutT (NUDIX family)